MKFIQGTRTNTAHMCMNHFTEDWRFPVVAIFKTPSRWTMTTAALNFSLHSQSHRMSVHTAHFGTTQTSFNKYRI
jgi:hypothetical protein